MKSILCGATRRFVKRQRAFGVIATRSDVEPGPYESLPGVETSSLLLLCRRMVNVNPPSGPVGLVAVFGEPSTGSAVAVTERFGTGCPSEALVTRPVIRMSLP